MKNAPFDGVNSSFDSSATPSISKAVRILDAVADAEAPLGISEISRRTGLGKSTVHNLTMALSETRLLRVVGDSKSYVLGSRLNEYVLRSGGQSMIDAAHAELRAIADTSGETSFLGRLTGEKVNVILCVPGKKALNLSAAVGSSIPLLASALGKSYFASLDEDTRTLALQSVALPRFTMHSVVETTSYRREVERARSRGYAIDRSEYLAGVAAAAACFNHAGTPHFVWIVAIDAGVDDLSLERLGNAVQDAAQRLAAPSFTPRSVATRRSAS